MNSIDGLLFRIPRITLIPHITPLHYLPGISRYLGVDVYIKRDDLTGFSIGGNKIRKLEYILSDAISRGADTIITMGAIHSNHALTTAMAARHLGMDVILILREGRDSRIAGNRLIEELLDIPVEIYRVGSTEELVSISEEIARNLEREGKRPYVIPPGGASVLGAMGYLRASSEIHEQIRNMGIHIDSVVVAVGSGGTYAGLLMGSGKLNPDVRVIGIDVGGFKKHLMRDVEGLIEETSAFLGVDFERDLSIYDYGFGAYGRITREVVETITLVASRDGILLDPIYTAKAFYGLMDLARKGKLGRSILFVHTGGIPALFHYGDWMLEIKGGVNHGD